MPGLVKRTTRTTQPQTAVGIDWSNPITKGLTAVFSSHTTLGGVTFQQNQKVYPLGVAKSKSSSRTDVINFSLPAVPGAVSLLAITNIKSFSAATFGTSTNGAVIYSQRTLDGDVSPTLIVSNSSFTGLNGYRLWFGADTAAVGNGAWIPEVIQTNKTYTFVGAMSAQGVSRLAVNGVFGALQSVGGVGNWTSSWSGSKGFVGTAPQWNTSDAPQDIFLVARWARDLSAVELKSLSDNPWQIFQPDVSYLDAIYQERLTISPDESRWIGSRGRSMEVSEVVQKVHNTIRTQQPQTPSGIDWGNPITRGLGVVYSPESSFNLIEKRYGTVLPSTAGKVNTYLSANDQIQIPLQKPFVFAGEFTFFCFASATSVTAVAPPIFGLRSPTSTMSMAYKIWQTSFFGFDARNGAGDTASTLTFPTTGKLVPCFVTYSNNVLRMRCNGQVFEIGRTLSAQIFTTFELHYKQAGPDFPSIGSALSIASIWNRVLSDTEIKSISANPWQLFKPQQKTLVYERQVPKVDPPVPKVRAMKLVKHVRTQQPQGPVAIDWINPLTKGILAALVPGTSTLITPILNTSIGSAAKLAILSAISIPSLKTVSITTLSIRKGNTSPSRDNYTSRITTSLGANVGFGHGTADYTANRVLSSRYFTNGSFSGLLETSANFLPPPTGQRITLTTTFEVNHTTGHNFYYNGELIATGPTTNASSSDGIRSGNLSFNDANAGSTQFDLPTVFVVIHDRVLTNAEIKSLSDNPWQIFQPESKTVWVDA